jgi:hypothetical protein
MRRNAEADVAVSMADDPQIAEFQKSTIPKYAWAVMEYKEPDISAIRGGIITSMLTKLATGAVLATAIPALARFLRFDRDRIRSHHREVQE